MAQENVKYVITETIKEAVKGRETELLSALNIQWHNKTHIHCPYPEHPDRNPSWRWDQQRALAYCTCSAGDNIFEVVRKLNSGDFNQAKVHIAEHLGRHDLIIDPSQIKYAQTDTESLLSPSSDRGNPGGLPVWYLAHRLGIQPVNVPMPSTSTAGWNNLEYWDPPVTDGGKPVLVGRFPCVVFQSVDAQGQKHAIRIYVEPHGLGKANLGTRSNETGQEIPRNPKKAAKRTTKESTSGRSVLWGDPLQADHIVLCEGVETGAALAYALEDELSAGNMVVASALSTSGIKAFQPWPETKVVTVAGDNDKHGQGLKAARAFAQKHYQKLSAAIAIPDTLGDWLDSLLREGKKAVLDGLSKATAYTPEQKTTPKKEIDASTGIDGFALNEDGLALAFADRHKNELLFCHTSGKWYHWDGARWKKEKTKLAFAWARKVCRDLNLKKDKALAKASTAGAVERFAQSDRAFAITSEIFDQNIWYIGTPDGTVNLKTGNLNLPAQSDYITKQTSVGPAPTADCPLWYQFLAEATQGDEDLIHFLQQVAGYCLTGDIREHALFFVHGDGGNGKGVFLNTITNILGEYATTSEMDTFTASKTDRHSTGMAMLQGARLVSASETEEGRAWAETRIKLLTGGDPITARFMRQDNFTFKPQFKLLIIGNFKPVLRNVDSAARRRFNIIPFVHKPPKVDRELEDKLKVEYPAILRWMIDGCLNWQDNGLQRPEVVLSATKDYFESQDIFRQWMEECCDRGRNKSDTTARLFESWKGWAIANGEIVGSQKLLSEHLIKLGFHLVKHTPGFRGKRGFLGLAIRIETRDNWNDKN